VGKVSKKKLKSQINKNKVMEKKTLEELIKENKAVAKLWNDYLQLFNYTDDKMIEGCDIAEKLLNKLNK